MKHSLGLFVLFMVVLLGAGCVGSVKHLAPTFLSTAPELGLG